MATSWPVAGFGAREAGSDGSMRGGYWPFRARLRRRPGLTGYAHTSPSSSVRTVATSPGLDNEHGDVCVVHNARSADRVVVHNAGDTHPAGVFRPLYVRDDIEDLFRTAGGAIRRVDHPDLVHRLDRLKRSGELRSPLPGLLCIADPEEDVATAILAGQLWAGPDAALTGRGAARLTFWPDCRVPQLTFASPRRYTVRHQIWRRGHRVIPPELIEHRGQINVTVPALTTIDLAAEPDGGDVIDRALRSRQVTLDQLWDVFDSLPNRRGNDARKRLLRDSRDRPWSEGERRLHRMLRAARMTGWDTNVWISIGSAQTDGYFADVLFRRERLIVEFDGWEFHSDRASFENDRRRRNELVLAGYRVLNFTWWQLVDDPDWVIDCIRRALGSRRR